MNASELFLHNKVDFTPVLQKYGDQALVILAATTGTLVAMYLTEVFFKKFGSRIKKFLLASLHN